MKPRAAAFAGDLSGAFADLGTFLPLVMGVFAVQRLDPTGILVGFGVFALVTAALYKRPVPVQPMKAVAALVIGGALGAGEVAAVGLLIGAVLLLLASTGAVAALARRIPEVVMNGVQVGVGLHLALAGLRLGQTDPLLGVAAVALLFALQRTRVKPLAALTIVALAAAWELVVRGAVIPELVPGPFLPELTLPDPGSFAHAAQTALLPQLALTLTNAVLITAALAADLFPHDKEHITPTRLTLSTGLSNLVLAPFGAFPMCHGAGGLVVQHRFGARTGLAPAIFGTTCLALGVGLGPGAMALMALVPIAAVGALLVLAGVDLAWSKRVKSARGGTLAVILSTALLCVMINVAVGFLAGLIMEALRTRWYRSRGRIS